MANMDVQHIRIKMVICPEEMEYVTELFRQSDWTLSEVGDPQELQDEISELYHWTLDVNQDQKEAIQYSQLLIKSSLWQSSEARTISGFDCNLSYRMSYIATAQYMMNFVLHFKCSI